MVFWAGILQAQMCVLDLQEELEKTEGIRAELRCCLPTASPDLPAFPSSPVGPRDSGLHPSPPVDVHGALGKESNGPEGENRKPAWPREGTPDSSPEWGPEEESIFFDNPLFLESPSSAPSVSEARFSWGFSDPCADVRTGPQSPQTLEPSPPGGSVPWELGREPDLGDSAVDPSGNTTLPFPVPTCRLHSSSWAVVGTTEGAPAAPPGQEESEVSRALGTIPRLCMGTRKEGPSSVVTRPRTLFPGAGAFGDPGAIAQKGRPSVAFRIRGNFTGAILSTEHDGN